MIYVTKFRANDLDPSKGKQIEFNSRVASEFFEFKDATHDVVFDCKSVDNDAIGCRIRVHMTLSPARGDYKVYQNADKSQDLKDFFLDVLQLNKHNINDYYAIKKKSESEYILYYIPASSLFSKFYPLISREQILYISEEECQEKDISYQKIFFGTPGSGKSHSVKGLTEGKKVHRTTFHPDSDYASFVGCYKPTMEGSEIKYSFTPQVFTEAYVDAWQNLEEEVYLVIEEINRGNCAQIFGDIFQLLDRNAVGYSDYRIKADSDLRDYLYDVLGEESEGIKGGELCLPPNLRILATMNTSDQSLFPMDSAFKRRWDWEYVPVNYSANVPSSSFVITLGGNEYRWVDFLAKINECIREVTDSEDKQMGNFFIKGSVSETEFKSKVMFYLWNEVCRDEYGTNNPKNFFRTSKEAEFSFNELYKSDGLEKLHGFMMYLGIPLLSTTEDAEEEVEQPEQA